MYSFLRRFIKLLKLCGNNPKELLINLYTWADDKTLNKILVNSNKSSFLDEIENNSPKSINHQLIEFLDFKYDLKSLNLRYSDRLGMYSSIEIRVPYLSTALLDYAKSLPNNFKFKFISNKYILRNLSKKLLPKYITKRPKTGFSLPLHFLLWNDENLVKNVFQKKNFLFNNYFNRNEIENLIQSFYDKKFNNAQLIFSLFILKKMFDKFYS